MMSNPKIARVLLGHTLLVLGLFIMPQIPDSASAADEAKNNPCDMSSGTNVMRAEKAVKQGTHLISGEVVRVDGGNYLVKRQNGKEVRVQTDQQTEKPEIKQGDHISANIDNQNHALWIRSNESTDRRSEHAAVDCNPN